MEFYSAAAYGAVHKALQQAVIQNCAGFKSPVRGFNGQRLFMQVF
jgi:hypothetical protein